MCLVDEDYDVEEDSGSQELVASEGTLEDEEERVVG